MGGDDSASGAGMQRTELRNKGWFMEGLWMTDLPFGGQGKVCASWNSMPKSLCQATNYQAINLKTKEIKLEKNIYLAI